MSRIRGHQTLGLQGEHGHVVEELVAYDVHGLPDEQLLVRRGSTDDRIRHEMLQRRVVRMESLTVQIRHGLQIQSVVEPAEDRAVVVAHYQHHLRARELAVHERAQVRVELREVLDEVGVTVDDDHDPLPAAQLLHCREQIQDVIEAYLLAREPGQAAADLVDVVGLQARHARQIDVGLVLAEATQYGGLPQMATAADRACNRHLLVHTL